MLRRALLLPTAIFVLAATVLSLGFSSFAQQPAKTAVPTTTEKDGIKKITDLAYVTDGRPRQRLDLYLPAKSTGVRPLVVWIHGGGWVGGTKAGVNAAPLLASGYAVASVEYRFSQDAPYPAQIEDCKAAIRWLRAHAAEYEIDPARIGAWGASAGGHLVALLGTTGEIHDFDKGENLDQSSAVQCVIDWFGPTDFVNWGADRTTYDRPDSLVSKLLGGPVLEKQDLARLASPMHFVTAKAAPFLIMHGDQDTLVPLQQSMVLNSALKKAGVASELITLKGNGHGGPLFTAPEQIVAMKAFIDKYLMPGTK
ncbi:MAG TPA: alpha/beta hydrolase [Chthoniobacteraceae bacterium]|jgi:acetyl esterase/lipase|nr:alpha/beta hydrolase [Chthoniobacteraceae bacterium]